ncbi:hypothetical protein ACIRST_38280 [Kitasatospora sp. NPDC101447]|uniref:hypothetical protein n=1 Tax=Kitasatospora sp. NPDC101447 TaxID=3364102 RepID=UPI00381CD5A2
MAMILNLLAQTANGSPDPVEVAVLAASALPVIGATISPLPTTAGLQGASLQFLNKSIAISFSLRVIAVLAWLAGLVMIISGDQAASTAIYTALGGSTFGALSMFVDRSVERSIEFAASASRVEREDAMIRWAIDGIADPVEANKARRQLVEDVTRGAYLSRSGNMKALKGSKALPAERAFRPHDFSRVRHNFKTRDQDPNQTREDEDLG